MSALLSGLARRAFNAGADVVTVDPEDVDTCRASAFLEEDRDGAFGFFHRSMLEYWEAEALVRDLQTGRFEMLGGARFTHLVPEFVAYSLKEAKGLVPKLLGMIREGTEPAEDNAAINAIEILGELNQMEGDHVRLLLLANTELLESVRDVANSSTAGTWVKEATLNLLSILGDEDAARALQSLYEREDFDYMADSAFGLEYYGSREVFLEECRRIAARPTAHFDQATCSYLLGEFGHREDVALLRTVQGETDGFVRDSAAKAIRKILEREVT
jgi:hypothetical protein